MWLSELSVSGFRNLAEQSARFDSRANLLFGPNGGGKTNILEAIAVLASGRSFRSIQDSQILGFDAPHFRIAGVAKTERDRAYNARVYFSPAESKHYFLDRKEIGKRALFSGWLPVSVFLLDDRRLISGPPAQRRAFLDDAVGKVSRTYRFLMADFRHVLAQRNALLKRGGGPAEYEVWEKPMAELAADIADRRRDYWKKFTSHFHLMSARFLETDELKLEYIPSVQAGEDYAEVLRKGRRLEEKFGHTRRGPHRDDFRILLNRRPLRAFGSYGQQRMAALALTLAEAETALTAGRRPVYLMDDVAAELDDVHTKLLFDLVKTKGQLFYTAAKPPAVEGKRFHVKKGKIRQV
ncbi:DNA replication and repair protein RecF [candidate division WOR-3 bacterium]|uniref:DNA replication and repair protein RecF n=1 Tax=candidate division WOR-3 bacterium TaxID=2052148 RepID=A0A9D5K8A1_UNCW3|nr:DNA replication and repair protein RecF [candidate division WOR-3 bacterium]MBD3363909.1 DNA replication and repair protein RecF [candidate division WOR-3 bacterium]